MKKVFGVKVSDKDYARMMAIWEDINRPDRQPVETLAEHIESRGLKTDERTSKKGVQLIKVFFENGIVREYEKSRINGITFFGV